MNFVIIAFILSFELPPELDELVPLAAGVPLEAMEFERPLTKELDPSMPVVEGRLMVGVTPVSACWDVPNCGVDEEINAGLPLGIVRDMLELSHGESPGCVGRRRLRLRPLKS
jgi:hypothetical protein